MALLLGFGDLWVVGRLRVLQGKILFVMMPNSETHVINLYTICLLPVKLGILRNCCNAFQEVWLSYV